MPARKTKKDPTHGFRQLDPVPPTDEISEFYESNYYDLIRLGGRAPELRRLRAGGEGASREQRWLQNGLYSDILTVLAEASPGKRVLDVGCGTGEFVAFAARQGFEAVGIEPAGEVVSAARESGLEVYQGNLREVVEEPPREFGGRFDAVVMLNVLEHVPDPVAVLEDCRSILNPDGILTVKVPNDFTEIQTAAAEAIGKNEWWVAAPDHINYFNFESLTRLFENLGFEVLRSFGDFPMELFLLMGDDYVGDPKVGSDCHARRVAFDLNLGSPLRMKIYEALAGVGIGRNCLVFARRQS